jgi:hypothetical protein
VIDKRHQCISSILQAVSGGTIVRYVAIILVYLLVAGCAATTFKAWTNDEVYPGKGGTVRKVGDLDVWEYGEPDRPYRVLGIIESAVPITGSVFVLVSMASMHNDVLETAKQQGADGIMFMKGSSTNLGTSSSGRSYFSLGKVAVAIKYVTTDAGKANIPTYEDYKKQMKQLAERNPQNYVEKAFAGVAVAINNDKECEVVTVGKGSPADKADIRIGDVILSIDGEKIKDRRQLFKIYDSKRPGETISGEIRRQGRVIKKDVTLDAVYMDYDFYVLNQELVKDIPLRIAIIVDEVDIQALNLEQKDMMNAKKTGESIIYAEMEKRYVSFCHGQTNCSIIERHNVDAILQELKFQTSNLVSDDMRARIGQLSGATHLMIASYTAYGKHKNGFQYQGKRKLVEVKSGKILFSLVDRGGSTE